MRHVSIVAGSDICMFKRGTNNILSPSCCDCFRLCQAHMEARMDPSNCVGLYHWARDLGATVLADCALRYLCQHFAEVGLSVLGHSKDHFHQTLT